MKEYAEIINEGVEEKNIEETKKTIKDINIEDIINEDVEETINESDGKFGIFTYNSDDTCIYTSYCDKKEKAVERAKELDLESGEYVEVWKKEDGVWGEKGSPIYKSDKVDESINEELTEEEQINEDREIVIDTYLNVL